MLMLLVMLVNVLLVDNLYLYTKLIILIVVKIFVLHLKYLVYLSTVVKLLKNLLKTLNVKMVLIWIQILMNVFVLV